jgi:hypothetical protein
MAIVRLSELQGVRYARIALLTAEPPIITRAQSRRSGARARPRSYIKTLQTDNEALKEQLSVERSALAAAEARAQNEADKAGQAIAAFASLAERLDALAHPQTSGAPAHGGLASSADFPSVREYVNGHHMTACGATTPISTRWPRSALSVAVGSNRTS